MWYDPNRNLLFYETARPEIATLKGAMKLVNGYVAVPADLHNLQHLAHLGMTIVPPLGTYAWPRSPKIRTPFLAQVATANFLVAHPHANCLSDMGTGKTLAALWAADHVMTDHLRRHGERIRTLVVAPLSTLARVWDQAIFENFLNKRKAVVLHGTPQKRIRLLAEEADFYLLNHDGIKIGARMNNQRQIEFDSFARVLANRADIRIVILDEVRAFSDYRTARSRVARRMLAKKDYVWGLTGTPTPNAPTDAYGISMLTTGAKGETWTSFRAKTMLQVSQYKWVARKGSEEHVRRLLNPSIRFAIEDCADLPELIYEDRDVELTPDQAKLMKRLKNDLLAMIDGGTISVANEASLRTKLMQAACGAVYDEDHRALAVDAAPRIEALRDIIEEAGSKIIVFAPFVSVVHMLHKALDNYSTSVIVGDTPVKEREKILRAFQESDDPRVLIAQPETIAHGLTLTAAATIVWYGPIDKTDTYIQANKRIHRPGQTKTCVVVHLSSTAVERETYRRLAANESLQGMLLKLVEEQGL